MLSKALRDVALCGGSEWRKPKPTQRLKLPGQNFR